MSVGAKAVPFADLVAQHRGLRDELLDAIVGIMAQGAFIGGEVVATFEKEFAEYAGALHAVGVANGTDALRLALLACGIGPGDSVVTVPNTFAATTAAISQVGAHIKFVDIEPMTCLMDPCELADYVERQIEGERQRLAAIVPVHLYGQCAEMDPIVSVAQRYGLKVVEDAAQAHGARYRGRPAGSLGDAASFSFYPSKNLGACGDAGAVTTSDPNIAEKVRILCNHGQAEKYVHLLEGWNSRLDALQAAMLSRKLRYLDGWNARRKQIAAAYDAAFEDTGVGKPVRVLPHNQSSYHLYIVHVPDRDRFRKHLMEHAVEFGAHYPIPLHLQPCYAYLGYRAGDFPRAERSARELTSLPIYPEMTDEQVERVVTAVEAW